MGTAILVEKAQVRVICIWCGEELSEARGRAVSHSLCPKCLEQIRASHRIGSDERRTRRAGDPSEVNVSDL